jgi:predicted RNase H-like HicB family nuclease
MADNMATMSESLELSIVYEDGGDGWIVASIPQVPRTHSQGPTREGARANVIDSLKVMLAGTTSRSRRDRQTPRRSRSPSGREASRLGAPPARSWGEIFGDEIIAAAMVDRLLHRAEILSLKGVATAS